MTPQLETITKAAQCAALLVSDIREPHKLACQDNPILEIVLREILGEVVRIDNRLAELQSTMEN
ncbi:MAG: hypothetical protein M5U12_05035 [Verrucomicrobia bacterium]|nr:hypothetical protein [Verrucomicrobiota bacterium]